MSYEQTNVYISNENVVWAEGTIVNDSLPQKDCVTVVVDGDEMEEAEKHPIQGSSFTVPVRSACSFHVMYALIRLYSHRKSIFYCKIHWELQDAAI